MPDDNDGAIEIEISIVDLRPFQHAEILALIEAQRIRIGKPGPMVGGDVTRIVNEKIKRSVERGGK